MKLANSFFYTLKEAPREAQISSHSLLFRSGMVQQLTSGVYNYLPFALRSIRKIEAIVREELIKAGCQEVLMPFVQPAELWEESGRWEFYGPELLRFKDRRESSCCLGPTHEEVFTDMVRRTLKSYKQLPINLFQIQTKFRDEIRPRFGLIRGREFIMKDGYSFDESREAAILSYEKMKETYTTIFSRLGLNFRAVEAGTGTIGGSLSHEFQALADMGEDTILACSRCDYAANIELAAYAVSKVESKESGEVSTGEYSEVHTPGVKSVEQVAQYLDVETSKILKSILYIVDEVPTLTLVAGDRDISEEKVLSFFKANRVRLAKEEEVKRILNVSAGFVGPIEAPSRVKIVRDHSIKEGTVYACGAGKEEFHLINVTTSDFSAEQLADISSALPGDRCPRCEEGVLNEFRGIEVGQTFYLGTKYSRSMGCTFLNREGKEELSEMGCYGIGISRILAAAIEQNHDENGIIWPAAIAPYRAIVLPLQMRDQEVVSLAEALYSELTCEGVDVLLDDRDERPGVKFKDADLIGYPLQVIISNRLNERGVVEVKERRSGQKEEMSLSQAAERIRALSCC